MPTSDLPFENGKRFQFFMNYLRSFERIGRMKSVATTLIFTLFGWAVGLPLLFTTTSAAQLTSVSATASSSAPAVSGNYIIQFTTSNAIGQAGAASTTRITFDPTTAAFSITSLSTSTNDISINRSGGGLTQVAVETSCTGATNEIYVSRIDTTSDYVEFRTCTGDTIAAGDIIVNLVNNRVTNPSSTGSYIIRIDGTMTDSGDTRVAIVDRVTVTASVDTNFTFTISGLASSTVINGDTTSTSTTATAIGFGRLSVGTSSIAGQRLSVQTNALNGFSVTVIQDQNLTSSNGSDIDAFQDGNPASSPTAWASPSGTIGNENSYGHFGVATADDTLSGGDLFANGTYVGLTSTSTRTLMYHDGPSDGTTEDVGLVDVAYRVQITSLQEAATDYTNRLTYVATPIF